MQQVIDFFKGLLDTSLWPPRWHCGQWSSFHGWLYIISDLLIASAYFAMPVIIVRYILTRTSSPFHKVYFLFAAFILACGFTHLLDAITFWYPVYRLSALVRFITGAISWVTVYYLIRLLPVAFSLKTAAELETEMKQRKKAEEELTTKIQQLNEAQEIARMGHWEWNLISDALTWSDGLFRVYGIPKTDGISYDVFLHQVHPDDRANVEAVIKQAISDKKFTEYYHRIIVPSGQVKTIHTKGELFINNTGEVLKMIGTGQDVTEQKNTELELLVKTAELETTNTDLQKFAYIASHDLQEPLRKIKTFISRLQSPDENDLTGEKEKLYMEKIVDASSRMQKLIQDILTYSRITADDVTLLFEEIDLNTVFSTVLSDMEGTIENSHAKIDIVNPLPAIEGNATQIGQLFQNLVSNSIKFQKTDTSPVITITSKMLSGREITAPDYIKTHYRFSGWKESHYWAKEKFCEITITDNGIGFEPEYAARVFEAFQRLNSSRKYEGTGIGLAICKKIAENHHGMITVKSAVGAGAAFTVTLPVSQINFEKR